LALFGVGRFPLVKMDKAEKTTTPEKQKKENLFLKKNLTILNYSLLNAVGKVDKSPYDPEYVKQKERAKDILAHYKDVQKTKKLTKGIEEMMEEESHLSTIFDSYAEKSKPDNLMSPKKHDPFVKAEAEFPGVLKGASTAINSILEVQKKLDESVKKFYEGVAALDHDCDILKELKEKYRILKLDYDQKLHTYNSLKKQKNVEPFKSYTAQQECEFAKKEMNQIYIHLCDELEHNKRKRDVDYANLLKELMHSYQEFFAAGSKIQMTLPNITDVKFERKKIFTKEELAHTAVFGVEIEDVIDREGPVPNLIKILLHHLKKNVKKEGLFRVSGEQPDIEKLKRQADEGDYNLDLSDIHVVSSAFKLYFRSLPSPLFTFKLYSSWIDVVDVTDKNEQLDRVLALFAAIPFPRRYIIGLVFDLLYEISQTEGSKMNANALAICWGNNLFKSSDPNPTFLMKETGKIQKITEFLIVNYPKIKVVFDEKWTLPEKQQIIKEQQPVQQPTKSGEGRKKSVARVAPNRPLPVLPQVKKDDSPGRFDLPPPVDFDSPRDDNELNEN
jgi:hypothetical protein